MGCETSETPAVTSPPDAQTVRWRILFATRCPGVRRSRRRTRERHAQPRASGGSAAGRGSVLPARTGRLSRRCKDRERLRAVRVRRTGTPSPAGTLQHRQSPPRGVNACRSGALTHVELQLISYQGQIAAAASTHRFWLAPELHSRAAGDPGRTFVIYMYASRSPPGNSPPPEETRERLPAAGVPRSVIVT
jgi:hypothetical protein